MRKMSSYAKKTNNPQNHNGIPSLPILEWSLIASSKALWVSSRKRSLQLLIYSSDINLLETDDLFLYIGGFSSSAPPTMASKSMSICLISSKTGSNLLTQSWWSSLIWAGSIATQSLDFPYSSLSKIYLNFLMTSSLITDTLSLTYLLVSFFIDCLNCSVNYSFSNWDTLKPFCIILFISSMNTLTS